MNKKKQVNESISSSAISPISYIILIDAANIIEKGRGCLSYIFPNENTTTLKLLFRKMQISDAYKETKDKLQSLSSRFDSNPSLVVLCKTLDRLKTMTFAETDRESHEKDIEKLIESVGGQISQGNGSRVRFKIGEAKATFHRPHPSPDTNKLTVKDIRDFLIVAGVKLE